MQLRTGYRVNLNRQNLFLFKKNYFLFASDTILVRFMKGHLGRNKLLPLHNILVYALFSI